MITELLASFRYLPIAILSQWKAAIFALLDLTDEWGRGTILSSMDAYRPIYKSVVFEWESSHKYKGNA